MKLLRWGIKIVLVLALVLGVLAGGLVLWLRQYVQTPEFIQDVKRLGSEVSGGSFEFDHLQWDIGRGLTVENVHLVRPKGRPEGPEAAASMQAWQVILKYDWPSLWNRRFEITRLTFKSPRFILRQQEDGDFVLPIAPPESPSAMPSSPIGAHLRAFNLDNGDIKVLGKNGMPLFEALNFQAEGQRPPGGNGNDTLSGVVNFSRLIGWGRIRANALQSPYSYENKVLKLSAVQGEFYGGRISGNWEQQFANRDLAYSAKLDVTGIEMAKLLKDAIGNEQVLTGKLDLNTTWLGPANRPADVSGEGSLILRQGRVLDVPLFRNLAERLPGLQVVAQPDFEVISAEYTVSGRQVKFRDLVMKSNLFEIAGEGTVGFDHKLDARLVLCIHPRLASRLPAEATSLMETREDNYKMFAIRVTGQVGAPKLSIPVSNAMREKAMENLRQYLGPLLPGSTNGDGEAKP